MILKSHPKMKKLEEVVSGFLNEFSNSKIIIFVQFRDTVQLIVKLLEGNGKAKPIGFVGKCDLKRTKANSKQKDQLETIEKFRRNFYNVLSYQFYLFD